MTLKPHFCILDAKRDITPKHMAKYEQHHWFEHKYTHLTHIHK